MSPANALRIMQQQLTLLSRSLGNVFIPILLQVIPYVIAFAQILRAVADQIANFLGFKLPVIDYSNLNSASGALGDVEDSANSATDAAEKLKGSLAGFDELNVIQQTDPTKGKSGIGSGGTLGLDLQNYDALQGLQNQMTEKVDKIKDKIKELIPIIEAVGTALLGWKIGKFISDLFKLPKALKFTAGLALTFGGLTLNYEGLKNIITTGELNNKNLMETLGGTATTAAGVAMMFGLTAGLVVGLVLLGIDLGAIYAAKIEDISPGITKFFAEKYGAEYENGNILKKFSINVQMVLTSMADLITTPLEWIGLDEKTKEGIITQYSDIWRNIFNLTNIFDQEKLKSSWSSAWNGFKSFFEGTIVGDFFGNTVSLLTNPDKWKQVWSIIASSFGVGWDNFKANWNLSIGNWWNQNVSVWFTYEKWYSLASNMKNGLFNRFNEIKSDSIGKFNEIWNSISSIFGFNRWWNMGNDIYNGLSSGVSRIVRYFENNFKLPELTIPHIKLPHIWVDWDFSGFTAKAAQFFGLPGMPKLNINWYAEGGLPDMGEMFIAREAGPELVGRIGNQSAVVNNNQIIAGVAEGVAQAVSEVLGGGDKGQPLIIEIGGETAYKGYTKSVETKNNQFGYNVVKV